MGEELDEGWSVQVKWGRNWKGGVFGLLGEVERLRYRGGVEVNGCRRCPQANVKGSQGREESLAFIWKSKRNRSNRATKPIVMRCALMINAKCGDDLRA